MLAAPFGSMPALPSAAKHTLSDGTVASSVTAPDATVASPHVHLPCNRERFLAES